VDEIFQQVTEPLPFTQSKRPDEHLDCDIVRDPEQHGCDRVDQPC